MSVGVYKKTNDFQKNKKNYLISTKILRLNLHALEKLRIALDVASIFVKSILISGLVGIFSGLTGNIFRFGLDYATAFRNNHFVAIAFLPLGGLLIVWLYRRTEESRLLGTNQILESIRTNRKIPLTLAPLIFLGTIITHLLGGSAGREGAALQLGGCLGYQTGRLFHLDSKEKSLIILCGMSGVFAALFDTPLTAVFFAMEVVSVGVLYYSALIPCLMSALTACAISFLLGHKTHFFFLKDVPELSLFLVLKVVGLAIVCALVSILFCIAMHKTQKLMLKIPGKGYLRAFLGGGMIIALTLALQTEDYNGAGLNIIAQALNGSAHPEAFLLKIIFTAITLGAGFKGGEIVPAFFIGATLGCFIGPFFGLDPNLAAAIGLIALFCGAVNCPVASIILSLELFGAQGLILFAIACGVSYMLSGNYGIYSSQKIVYSKLKAEFINVNAR
ncbi:MAG: chloride channel protein [Planctomycetia bacterium]|nr:chloride channel protein [Planctomycetia bacterium]